MGRWLTAAALLVAGAAITAAIVVAVMSGRIVPARVPVDTPDRFDDLREFQDMRQSVSFTIRA